MNVQCVRKPFLPPLELGVDDINDDEVYER